MDSDDGIFRCDRTDLKRTKSIRPWGTITEAIPIQWYDDALKAIYSKHYWKYREETAPDVSDTFVPAGIVKLPGGYIGYDEMVDSSMGGGDCGGRVSPYPCCVRTRTESEFHLSEKIGLSGSTSEHEGDSIESSSCERLAVSYEGTCPISPIRNGSYAGFDSSDGDNECSKPASCSETSGTGSEMHIGHPPAKKPKTRRSSAPTVIHCVLLANNTRWVIPDCVLAWTVGNRQDAMGYRAVQISVVGEHDGGLKTIQARPARWDSIRRYMSIMSTFEYGYTPTGLGSPEDDQRQVWECYDPCADNENNYFESLSRKYVPNVSRGTYPRRHATPPRGTRNRVHVCQASWMPPESNPKPCWMPPSCESRDY